MSELSAIRVIARKGRRTVYAGGAIRYFEHATNDAARLHFADMVADVQRPPGVALWTLTFEMPGDDPALRGWALRDEAGDDWFGSFSAGPGDVSAAQDWAQEVLADAGVMVGEWWQVAGGASGDGPSWTAYEPR